MRAGDFWELSIMTGPSVITDKTMAAALEKVREKLALVDSNHAVRIRIDVERTIQEFRSRP